MENVLTAVPLVVVFPVVGLLINLFFGGRFSERGVGYIASSASGAAFVVALFLWAGLADNNWEAVVVDPPILDAWIRLPSAGIDIPWQFRVDSLSVTMMLVVSGVGTLIHIYAIGYMHGDSRFPRFFVYLNLFLAFMMILVTANNLLMMFVGWEGVGLCSFLLIGFWFDKAHGEGWKNSNAARKAFIVNRVGDFGVLLAIFFTFWTFGTLDFYKTDEAPIFAHGEEAHGEEAHGEEAGAAVTEAEDESHGEESHATVGQMGIFNQAQTWIDEGGHQVRFGSIDLDFDAVLTLITLFMVIGVTGKSAQIPLFVWLPDAMAGPTPVSALIHAATMVTAGVYMMVRSNVFFHEADITSFIVAMIGALTALMAGFIALGQWDVKRVLAYSTVSQLGFMVAAVGIGAYGAAMFHLVTHAVFKALLFLGSGSIIHGMEHGHHHLHEHGHDDEHHDDHFDPQDMRTMGGLRQRMPITFWTYIIGTLALAGIFPFAGFWSKDEILADAFNVGWEDGELAGFIVLLILTAAAFMTAFYMWRQVSLVFLGAPRHEAAELAEESNSFMTIPLILLAIGSILIGFINIPTDTPIFSALVGEHFFTDFLEHSVVFAHSGTFIWWLALGAVGLAVGAIFLARTLYTDRALESIAAGDPLEIEAQTAEGFRLANARLYWDEIYFRFIENPYNMAGKWLANRLDWDFWHDFVHERVIFLSFHEASRGLSENVDRGAIDKGIMGIFGVSVSWFGSRIRRIQTGYVRTYALTVVLGAVVVLIAILFPSILDILGI